MLSNLTVPQKRAAGFFRCRNVWYLHIIIPFWTESFWLNSKKYLSMTCTTLSKKLKKCMKMKFLKINSAETILKSLQKILIAVLKHNSLENLQTGKSAVEKQNKKKLKPKFFIKSFSYFSNLPYPVKPTLLFVVKTARLW